jgi:DNA-binding NarL/FixJ family response regulator
MRGVYAQGLTGAQATPFNSLRGTVKVLLVEDSPPIEKFIRAALTQRLGVGIRMESKSSLSEALDALRCEPFDAIIVDFSVSDLQAPDGLERIGAMARRFPVVVLIDPEQTDRLITARDLRIHSWLVKETLTPSRLADHVKSAFELQDIRKRI